MKYANRRGSSIKVCKTCGVTLEIGVNCTAARFKHWNYVCMKCAQKRSRNYVTNLRIKALNRLGGKCTWPGCDIKDKRMLQVDHICGGGNLAAKNGFDYRKSQIEILKLGDKELFAKYQLLCANHNRLKQFISNEGITKETAERMASLNHAENVVASEQ